MVTALSVLSFAKDWLRKGCNKGGKDHAAILSIYNNHKPLARGYMVKPSDQWCMTFISCLFIQANSTDVIGGTECSCQNAINLSKKAGIWRQGTNQIPKQGDIIFYDWDKKGGWADHVGIVEQVVGTRITVIEGNYNNKVCRRTIDVGNPCIIGYARPKYSTNGEGLKSLDLIAKEVVNGKWGNGVERTKALEKAGYDPTEVQRRVNELLDKS